MRSFIGIVFLLLSHSLHAEYDKNIEGNIVAIYTYPSGTVLFKLDNQPTNHPSCNPVYFAIAKDVPESAANRMYSRLLSLHTTKTKAYIGFDSQGGCGDGYIRVHNVGGN
ncbi:hypothetical protein [Aliikangiella maris]|uniref:Uncharacterized protein n=2 Tax=Aliikangiella maris TaxID=3162458 RepID=A0ABV2C0D3_9GAMM